jgi:hypothetical protein
LSASPEKASTCGRMHSLATAFIAVVAAVATAGLSDVQPRTAVEKNLGRWAQHSEAS